MIFATHGSQVSDNATPVTHLSCAQLVETVDNVDVFFELVVCFVNVVVFRVVVFRVVLDVLAELVVDFLLLI
jgi:hypothetical protein